MNDLSIIDTTGLHTRSGSKILKLHKFEWSYVDRRAPYQSVRGKRCGTWWAVGDLQYDDGEVRKECEIDVGNIMHETGDETGHEKVNIISKLCMDYLFDHGTFHKSYWCPNE